MRSNKKDLMFIDVTGMSQLHSVRQTETEKQTKRERGTRKKESISVSVVGMCGYFDLKVSLYY